MSLFRVLQPYLYVTEQSRVSLRGPRQVTSLCAIAVAHRKQSWRSLVEERSRFLIEGSAQESSLSSEIMPMYLLFHV